MPTSHDILDASWRLNRPLWNSSETSGNRAFQEVWYLKVNDPATDRALWLRFTLMVSANGFKKIAETWAVFFQRGTNKEVSKLALKQTYDVGAFSAGEDRTLKISECELGSTWTRGKIQSKGKTIQWDLQLQPGHDATFNLVPPLLNRAKLVKNTAVTVSEDLRFSGTTEIDGVVYEWKNAAGMQAHLSGTKNGHSWVWSHCNLFVDEQGKPVPFLFEGLSGKARWMGSMSSPRMTTLLFHYEGVAYRFNSLWDALTVKSSNSLSEWTFRADRGDLSFRGRASAELKDFAGLTYEDTDGSLLYCANSKLSNLQIHVYRNGKLESAFYSHGTAAFEVVSREKNPYVPILA